MHHLINSYLIIELYEQRFPNDAAILFESLADTWDYYLESADEAVLKAFWESLELCVPKSVFESFAELYGAV